MFREGHRKPLAEHGVVVGQKHSCQARFSHFISTRNKYKPIQTYYLTPRDRAAKTAIVHTSAQVRVRISMHIFLRRASNVFGGAAVFPYS
jgi:hypothetical protein